MNNLDEIKEYFNSLEEVKRIKELEPLIDKNENVRKSLDEVLDLQHKLVYAKVHKDLNYESLFKKYNQKKEELISLPFLEEYLELLSIVEEILKNYSYEISLKINKDING